MIDKMCQHWYKINQYFCSNNVKHWWVGTWRGPSHLKDIREPKLCGFCDEHCGETPEHGNWVWKPISKEEAEVYKIMDS